ncbi:hypothetical protein [Urbifossiella limnaea]|uniref:Carboxypeptidase regulatory-like domain-containing protein n=1 Tax=Urbifossiella limnaea TaxID=2528023 RepID=A0A517Y219_9BACT|nr:hypothetical protein [Urbifossiella limnaea]QDU23811.1 hypothetical protein ETAA1_58190 [Urbifossiella limnaea]
MTSRLLVPFALTVAVLTGCSSTPAQRAEPSEVKGILLLPNGQPAKDVTLVFLATSTEQMGGAAVIQADGKFTARLNTGKYTYVMEGKNALPKYTANKPEHSVEIPSGGTQNLTIKLEN